MTIPSLRDAPTIPVVAILVAVLASSASAQRRIEAERIGSGPLYKNPAGRALGSGTVARPNGILGDGAMTYGNALDGNLQVGSNGFNSRSARSNAYTYRNLQARNLIVTNGVAGGRGFRGDVGYLAPGDFAGETGGDSTYDFRRDSALSGLEFLSSSRQIDTFNIAQGMGVFQYRRDFTTLPEANSVESVSRLNDAEIRLDRANAAIRTGNLLDTAVAPSDIGLVQAADGEIQRAMSSTVRGLQFPSQQEFLPSSVYEQAMFNQASILGDEDVIEGFSPERFITPLDRSGDRDASIDDGGGPILDGDDRSRYDAILQRVIRKYEGRDDVTVDESSIDRLRGGLDRIDAMLAPKRLGTTDSTPAVVADERRVGPPGQRLEPSGADLGLGVGPREGDEEEDALVPTAPDGETPTDGAEPPDAEEAESADEVRSVQELIDALTHGESVGTLVDPKMRIRVQQIVDQAETAMREGEFFRAEDRFDVALQLNPGNPMLEGGLANAQIGAGLYRSAGVTLARLFRDHELMIDLQWEAGLIPNETRLKIAASEIRAMIRKNPGNAGALGLVLAYIGRQIGDPALVVEGLDLIDDSKLQRQVELLRAIWVGNA